MDRVFCIASMGISRPLWKKLKAEMNRVYRSQLKEMDEVCPECGRNLVIRTGRFGRFISCSGFPECRYRRSFMNKPVPCVRNVVVTWWSANQQKKRIFYGCSNYPTCNFAIWERPVPDLCPNCGGLMVIPRGGQEPICYTEVVALQRTSEEKPRQDGSTSQRAARKKTASSEANLEAASTEAKTTRRTSTTRKKASTTAGELATGTPAKTRTSKTTTRGSTTRKHRHEHRPGKRRPLPRARALRAVAKTAKSQ